jgi:hypothetical protein
MTSSAGVRGASAEARAAKSGAGSAARSVFPLGVSGSRSKTTTAAGTMYSGSTPAACSRSTAGSTAAPGAGTTYPASRFWPGLSSRAITTACATPS